MYYYLYILKSLVAERHYIGSAEDISIRLKQHNQKRVRSTKAYVPWEIVYGERFATKKEARQRELELKNNSWKRNQLFQSISKGPIV